MAHNKTLTELKWFKWALWGPIGAAVFVATVIGIADFTSEDLRVCFTSSCVNDAISRLKLSLAIASLAFPLVALVASHHRSVQTAAQIARTDKQIETTEAKNAFENTLKHREQFDKKLESIEKNQEFIFQDKTALYNLIFPDNDGKEFFSCCDHMSLDVYRMGVHFDEIDEDYTYIDYIDNRISGLNSKLLDEELEVDSGFIGKITIDVAYFLFGYLFVNKISNSSVLDFKRNGIKFYEGLDDISSLERLMRDINTSIDSIRRFSFSQEAYRERYFDDENFRVEGTAFHVSKISENITKKLNKS